MNNIHRVQAKRTGFIYNMSYGINSEIVDTAKKDFLDEDAPIRGQNFVCLSFLSPEDVLKKKEVYMFNRFVQHFSAEVSELFEGLTQKYPADKDGLGMVKERFGHLFDHTRLQDEFVAWTKENTAAADEFNKENNFRTSIRGVKVRGSFDTLDEAKARADVLKDADKLHNIFIGQVGCWCPWSPNPDDIGDQKFDETQLNTLMKNYNEIQSSKGKVFDSRREEMMKDIEAKTAALKEANSNSEAITITSADDDEDDDEGGQATATATDVYDSIASVDPSAEKVRSE